MEKVIVIVGPTGVGKTKLSVELAKRLNGEIISGDSVQVYRRMDIGSAKVTEEEKEGIEHYLVDIKDIDEEYSVYEFQKEVREKMTPLQRKMGENNDIIMEGRDIGTVIFPNADVKVFLDCSVEERAMRRYKQNISKGIINDLISTNKFFSYNKNNFLDSSISFRVIHSRMIKITIYTIKR